MHRLSCPQCQHPIPVAVSKAGAIVSCPECGAEVAVPKLGELKRLPLHDNSAGRSPSGSPSSAGSPLPFVLMACIATAAVLGAGYCGLRYVLTDVPMTTEEHLREYKQGYETASPATLIREYEDMEKYGLELGEPMLYKSIEQRKSQWGRSTLLCGGVAAVAILGCVALSRGRSRPSA